MSGFPAGWYPSPDDPAQQRYWDGVRWTEHVAGAPAPGPAPPPAPAPGWLADPQVPGQLRYWDGRGWTDQVQSVPLFDGMVEISNVMRRKKQHLRVTADEVVWGDEHIRWNDVTFFNQLITLGNLTTFEVWLAHGGRETGIVFAAGKYACKTEQAAYDAIILQLRRTLGERVINGLLEMVANGEAVRTGGLLFAPDGFAVEAEGGLVPWTEFGGMEIVGDYTPFLRMFRQDGHKPKRVVNVKVDQLRAWAIPPVVDAFARRYGHAPVN